MFEPCVDKFLLTRYFFLAWGYFWGSPHAPQEFLPKNRGHPNLLFSYLIAPFFSKCIRFLIHRLPPPPPFPFFLCPPIPQASLSLSLGKEAIWGHRWVGGEGFTYLYLIYVYRISWYSVSFDSMARTLLYQKNKQQKSIVLEKSTLVVTSEFPWAWITYASQRLMGFWLGGRDPPRRKREGGERGMFITAHIDVEEEEAEPRVSCQHEFKHRLSLFQIVVCPIWTANKENIFKKGFERN